MEMFRRGTFPSCSPQPLSAPFSLWLTVTGWGQSCPAGIVLGSSRLAFDAVPALEGLPGTVAQVGTRRSPPAPGLGETGPEHVPAQGARRLEAHTPGRANSYTPCSRPSVPMRPAGFFHRIIKCQPNRASAATPWTVDKSCQGSGLCPRSADCEAPHLPPCPDCRVSLGHRFEYVSVSPLNFLGSLVGLFVCLFVF